jgi:hypothetical protein
MRVPQEQTRGSASKIFLTRRAHVLLASLEVSELSRCSCESAAASALSPSTRAFDSAPVGSRPRKRWQCRPGSGMCVVMRWIRLRGGSRRRRVALPVRRSGVFFQGPGLGCRPGFHRRRVIGQGGARPL